MEVSASPEFDWLVSHAAAPFLDQALADFRQRINPLKIAKRLRNSISPTHAALVMEQAQLRIRAAKKFPLADRMFFTQRGLEQSSGQRFAVYKAKFFSDLESVADVCCGIGGDLMALISRSEARSPVVRTVGVDSDRVTSLFARKNLELQLLHDNIASDVAIVRQTDFESLELSEYAGLHVDPDRRKSRRTIDGRHFCPSLPQIFERVGDGQRLAVKVAPATPSAEYFPKELHRQWLGDRRECKQQLLWLNSSHPPGRSATLITTEGQSHSIDCGGEEKVAREIALDFQKYKYIYEPRSVVLAAGLDDHLAVRHQLMRFTYEIPYYFSDQSVVDPLLSCFEVRELLKLDLKTIQAYLSAHNIGQIELKQRGIDQVTWERVRKLKLTGQRKMTLILTRFGPKEKRLAIVAKRVMS